MLALWLIAYRQHRCSANYLSRPNLLQVHCIRLSGVKHCGFDDPDQFWNGWYDMSKSSPDLNFMPQTNRGGDLGLLVLHCKEGKAVQKQHRSRRKIHRAPHSPAQCDVLCGLLSPSHFCAVWLRSNQIKLTSVDFSWSAGFKSDHFECILGR